MLGWFVAYECYRPLTSFFSFDTCTEVTSKPMCVVGSRRCSTCVKSSDGASFVTEGVTDTIWVSGSSPEFDDGGEGDTDVAKLVEDGVGESLPYEVDARGEFGSSREDGRRRSGGI